MKHQILETEVKCRKKKKRTVSSGPTGELRMDMVHRGHILILRARTISWFKNKLTTASLTLHLASMVATMREARVIRMEKELKDLSPVTSTASWWKSNMAAAWLIFCSTTLTPTETSKTLDGSPTTTVTTELCKSTISDLDPTPPFSKQASRVVMVLLTRASVCRSQQIERVYIAQLYLKNIWSQFEVKIRPNKTL